MLKGSVWLLVVDWARAWNAAVVPKAHGALNLDAVSATRLPHLEQFVIFSSVVSSTGNEGAPKETHPHAQLLVSMLAGEAC